MGYPKDSAETVLTEAFAEIGRNIIRARLHARRENRRNRAIVQCVNRNLGANDIGQKLSDVVNIFDNYIIDETDINAEVLKTR